MLAVPSLQASRWGLVVEPRTRACRVGRDTAHPLPPEMGLIVSAHTGCGRQAGRDRGPVLCCLAARAPGRPWATSSWVGKQSARPLGLAPEHRLGLVPPAQAEDLLSEVDKHLVDAQRVYNGTGCSNGFKGYQRG